jgi:hypothetical protein
LIKRKPGFSGKIFWTLEIPFKTSFTVYRTAQKKIVGVIKFRRLEQAMELEGAVFETLHWKR